MPEEKKVAVLPLIALGIVMGLFLKLFVIDVLQVSGSSMEDTIHDESVIAVNRLAYGISLPFSSSLIVQWKKPQCGDIVIYLYNNKIVVKRCVAAEGDALDYSVDSGYSLLTGGNKITLTFQQYEQMKNSHYVPEGYILAVGDNYSKSIDSRTYGFVPAKNILGKVIWK